MRSGTLTQRQEQSEPPMLAAHNRLSAITSLYKVIFQGGERQTKTKPYIPITYFKFRVNIGQLDTIFFDIYMVYTGQHIKFVIAQVHKTRINPTETPRKRRALHVARPPIGSSTAWLPALKAQTTPPKRQKDGKSRRNRKSAERTPPRKAREATPRKYQQRLPSPGLKDSHSSSRKSNVKSK